MTVRLLVQCDGTPDDRPGMALERCRAFLPLHDPQANAAEYRPLGWSRTPDGRHLCPACTRTTPRKDTPT